MKKIHPELFFVIDCTNILRWVGLMNNIRASAEETVLAELIYTDV